MPQDIIESCLNLDDPADRLFALARRDGLTSLPLADRRRLNRVTGDVAESVAEILLADVGLNVFWHITTPGIHGVDLLFLTPDESVLALEVKGTLRARTIPRLTPSRLRQMSCEWLNGPDNPAMAEWEFEADDLYAGVMTVDLAEGTTRICVSADFLSYLPIAELQHLQQLATLLD
jgi:hypothetical protein